MGGRARRLGGLLVIVNLVVVVVILLLPRRSFLPASLSLSPVILSDTASVPSTPVTVPNVTAYWSTGLRLATFCVLTGRKDDNSLTALFTETVGSCRSLPSNATSSVCQGPADIYLLYSSSEELQAAQAVVNKTRYCNQFIYLPLTRGLFYRPM